MKGDAVLEPNWFDEARYGMFIHWGAYSVAARGEWVRNREQIPPEEYVEKYAKHFRAENYDPRQWARLAKASGMKYVVLTTRHHDGFCLWNTSTTEFNATKLGPMRDLVQPFVEAVRAEGLKVGLYYSLADWNHPDYPTAYARDWPTQWRDEPSRQRFVQYYTEQLRELMSNYGKIDILWYDGCIPSPTDGRQANERVKQLQPHILINERNGEPFDYRCSEQSLAAKDGPWEACMTLNDNWGYHAGDHHWKTARDVISMLVTTAKSGGNLLLNVGPRADGMIPEQSVRILQEAGAWLNQNGEFLPNSTRSPFAWTNICTLTTKGNIVYAHIFYSPGDELCLAEIANKVLAVRVVASGRQLPFEQKGPRLFIRNLQPLDPIATTLAIDVQDTPRPAQKQEIFWIPG